MNQIKINELKDEVAKQDIRVNSGIAQKVTLEEAFNDYGLTDENNYFNTEDGFMVSLHKLEDKLKDNERLLLVESHAGFIRDAKRAELEKEVKKFIEEHNKPTDLLSISDKYEFNKPEEMIADVYFKLCVDDLEYDLEFDEDLYSDIIELYATSIIEDNFIKLNYVDLVKKYKEIVRLKKVEDRLINMF